MAESRSAISFTVLATDPASGARAGRLETPHGAMETPAFVVPAGQGVVASLQPDEVAGLGAQATAVSLYQFVMRPGADQLSALGGLHTFSGWSGPIFVDNGGYQLARLGGDLERYDGLLVRPRPAPDQYAQRRAQERAAAQGRIVKVDDDGVTFRSHLDGSTHRWTPETFVQLQEQCGADLFVALSDEFAAAGSGRRAVSPARAVRWAERTLAARQRTGQGLYASVAVSGRARGEAHCEAVVELAELPFDGFALSGPGADILAATETALRDTIAALPSDRPRHLTALGDPSDLFAAARAGIDTFESAAPTRYAAHGLLLTAAGPLDIKRVVYREDDGPPDPTCVCPTCTTFTRAYLRHLFAAEELLAYTLAATHNLAFFLGLTARVRAAIIDGVLDRLEAEVLAAYPPSRRGRPARLPG
ncbi:MAG: queuine tRNA-ribosyltransferase family protein [Chloroflexi bacterium]|nr:queuine tRNA-ribosyltransferase family protein [Chloroflexota bacterium]